MKSQLTLVSIRRKFMWNSDEIIQYTITLDGMGVLVKMHQLQQYHPFNPITGGIFSSDVS